MEYCNVTKLSDLLRIEDPQKQMILRNEFDWFQTDKFIDDHFKLYCERLEEIKVS
jgi:hypothetical protein